ncbi:MAG: dipeptidase [Burkholderiaceae bacterium]|nr:dipeptidase [Burkholderiaceae bacterium]MDO9090985.1 dipeptidase [Burkholderiaceae bacterium]
MSPDLHQRLNVHDGLGITSGGRAELEQMVQGGLTSVNCTCSVWEGFRGTMERIARWKQSFVENADLALQVYKVSDIARAKAQGKVGIILGWQNTSAIEDQLPFIQIFHELGVRVVQLTYNTQNLLGTGCYESRDSGLSDFGREAIDEFNRVRMLIDLSHVGPKTSAETIAYSKLPVCYTHVAPRALKDHPRNKTDEELKFIVDRGGFIGLTFFVPFLHRGEAAGLEDFIEVVEHTINIVGEDRIGFGTDLRVNYPSWSIYWKEDSHVAPMYWAHDKGYARQLTRFTEIRYPGGFKDFTGYPMLTRAMEQRGWSESRIRKVMGDNWIRFLGEVWGDA